MWSIIVHGGAGAILDSVKERHLAGCRRAAEAGASVLGRGGVSLDAVCAAVRVLEDDPTFNAAHGGALDERGFVTVDAAVMRGSDLAYGAVGAVAGVRRAVDLARAVLEDKRHSLLVGRPAVEFARRKGVPLCDPEALVTEHTLAEWRRRSDELRRAKTGADPGAPAPEAADMLTATGGTVGAVAIDQAGVISAATSTGGLVCRYAGRVGDSPIAGAGTYARDDLGGVSATGHGETMMRTVLAYQVLLALRGVPAESASATIRGEIDQATARAGGRGGLIAVLPGGAVAWARNTPHMGVAWAADGQPAGADF